MSLKTFIIGVALCGTLAACGETLGEQALAGGAIGASAAVLGDGTVTKGIAIGAVTNIAYCQLNPDQCQGY
jgi:deoxyxylulose-5-phosphate synthase